MRMAFYRMDGLQYSYKDLLLIVLLSSVPTISCNHNAVCQFELMMWLLLRR